MMSFNTPAPAPVKINTIGGIDPLIVKGWYDNLVTSEVPGLLYKNACVEVLFKHEYRGSQARVTLK
jgi:hypothetical protein